jgi:hypothetical protein
MRRARCATHRPCAPDYARPVLARPPDDGAERAPGPPPGQHGGAGQDRGFVAMRIRPWCWTGSSRGWGRSSLLKAWPATLRAFAAGGGLRHRMRATGRAGASGFAGHLPHWWLIGTAPACVTRCVWRSRYPAGGGRSVWGSGGGAGGGSALTTGGFADPSGGCRVVERY